MLIGFRRKTRMDNAVKGMFNGGYKGVWYDFSDPTSMWSDTTGTVITPGGSISSLFDKSGNGNNFSQASAQPTWNAGGYAAFNGSQYLQMTAATGASALNWSPGLILEDQWTFLAVLAAPSVVVGTYLWSFGNSAGGNVALSVGTNNATATTLSGFMRSDESNGITNTTVLRTGFFAAGRQFVGLSMQGPLNASSGRLSSYIDDAKTIHSAGSMATNFTLNRFTLGALGRNAAPTANMTVNLYQFLLINRVLRISEIIRVKSHWNNLVGA